MVAIRGRAESCALMKSTLLALVRDHPELFDRPRTRVVEGIRIGFRKAKGRLEIADEARSIALIRRHLAEISETLVKVKESLVKAALARLPAADLRRVGVTLVETGDEPVVEPTAGELEKLVDALLDDGAGEEDET
jgi:hypothetical protein